MGYVMVPVPEQHVQEAMEAVLRITRRALISDWDEESVRRLFESVDEAAKSVLSAVARAMKVRPQVPDIDVAQAIEISQREVLGVIRELVELAAESSHPHMISVQQSTETLPNGRTVEARVLIMQAEVAELVRAAEAAERDNAPHPLVGGVG